MKIISSRLQLLAYLLRLTSIRNNLIKKIMKKSTKTIAGLVMTMVLLAVSTGSLQAKGIRASGKYVTKEIKADSFASIQILGSEDILYSQSNNGKSSIKVYASDNVMDLLDIRVNNGTLIVSYKKNVSIWGDNTVKVIVSSPSLNKIDVMGSGDVALKTAIKSDKLSVSVSGSGDINGANITCNNLSINVQGSGDIQFKGIKSKDVNASVAGSGDITLSGETENANLSTAGSGDIKSGGLRSQNVDANTIGSGDISCFAVKHLKARVVGSGDINYKGSPIVDGSHKRNLHNLK